VNVAFAMRETRWSVAEAHLISRHAYKRGLDVEPWVVLSNLTIWRMWYYGMVSDGYVATYTGVYPMPSYGK
jgi:hypothetical protein